MSGNFTAVSELTKNPGSVGNNLVRGKLSIAEFMFGVTPVFIVDFCGLIKSLSPSPPVDIV